MNTKHLIGVIALTGSLSLFATAADAQPGRTVDCDRGDSIQAALDRQVGHSGPITIDVVGACTEDVNITRDDVTINGNSTATVSGTIKTEGVNRVLINGLTITGTGQGLIVYGGRVTLVGVHITQNEEDGLWAIQNSWVKLFNTTVAQNGNSGVFVQTSTIEVDDSKIMNNNSDGISSDIEANTVVRNSKITGNLRSGLSVSLHSVTQLRDSTEVSGNNLGAWVVKDSALVITTSDVIFPDMISCGDTESSFANEGGVPTGTNNCTDFNQVAPTP